ncbi:unnamed protein product [Cuscuta epithymum]|uniref:RING-type E3 ubiquitin transferase n=1 Tax=Cuscuta epithymum TaxID=186058 RepID=A0AAV0ELD5_9ASTE|nr:unnamed protein product [Cuscuta epithymum]
MERTGLSEDEIGRLQSDTWESCGGEDDRKQRVCAVCLSEYARGQEITTLLPICSHDFHKYCIAAWLRRNATCPLCRRRAAAPQRPPPASDVMSLMPHNVFRSLRVN